MINTLQTFKTSMYTLCCLVLSTKANVQQGSKCTAVFFFLSWITSFVCVFVWFSWCSVSDGLSEEKDWNCSTPQLNYLCTSNSLVLKALLPVWICRVVDVQTNLVPGSMRSTQERLSPTPLKHSMLLCSLDFFWYIHSDLVSFPT